MPSHLPSCAATHVAHSGRDTSQHSTFGDAVCKEALSELLRGGQRLITLTGTAGAGKTKLALQAAANSLQDFPDGVWFVDLAGVSDPGTLPAALAIALNISLAAERDSMQQVLQHLKERISLLVLDNFKQVMEAAVMVQGLVETCPRLQCVVTSRELLRIASEREFVVEPRRAPSRTT